MSLTQVFDGQTTTGASTPLLIDRGPRGSATAIGIHVDGITTGAVQVQFAPTSTGTFITADDGEKTANFFLLSKVPNGWWIRLNVSDATSVDIDAYISGAKSA